MWPLVLVVLFSLTAARGVAIVHAWEKIHSEFTHTAAKRTEPPIADLFIPDGWAILAAGPPGGRTPAGTTRAANH